jgi:hypothetical protein
MVLEPKVYYTQGKQANHCTTDVVGFLSYILDAELTVQFFLFKKNFFFYYYKRNPSPTECLFHELALKSSYVFML